MNRKFTFLLCALLLSLAWNNGLKGQCSSLYDDFESGSLNPSWQFGTGSYVRNVTNVSPAVGVYSFEQTGSSSFYQGTYQNFTPAQPSYISWWAKTNNTSAANGYFVAGDGNIASDNGILFVYFNSSSGLRFFASTGYNHPITANTWYHIEVTNINYTARTMDISVNGTQILTGWPFRSATATQFDRVHLFNLSSATATYDNIQFGYPGPGLDSLTIVDVACNGDTDGSIEFTTTGGTAPYSYAWSTGDTIEDLQNLSAGTYTVNVTDGNGCVTVDSFVVAEPAALMDSSSISVPMCPGMASGSINVTVSGGTPGYSYSWSTGDTSANLNGIGSGSYSLVVTDAAGCTLQDSFSVTGPAAWMNSAVIMDVLCNGDQNGSIDLSVSGGSPGYSYMWSTGDSTEDLNGLGAGGYSVVIMDSLGCVTQDSFNLSEPTAVQIVSAAISDEVSTGTLGAIDLTVSGGTPGYSFVWSDGSTTEDISNLNAGTYSVTITDGNGCTLVDSFVVDFIVSSQVSLEETGFSAYPNPFNDQLTMRWDPARVRTGSIRLSDLQGRVVIEFSLDEFPGGNMSQNLVVPQGVYFLHLQTSEVNQTIKLIRQ